MRGYFRQMREICTKFCVNFTQILREFCSALRRLNPFCAFPRITRERDPLNFGGDCTVSADKLFHLSVS